MLRARIGWLGLLGVLLAVWNAPLHAQPTDLLISEYIEGSSFNKAIELYNGTGSAVDLSAYTLAFYFNGNTSPGTSIPLDAVLLAEGATYVVADDGADPAILAVTDQTSNASFFNGDDAVVLSKDGVIVDVIGQVGVDPGSEWGSGDASTANNTLRRNASACVADTNPDDAFDPSVDYDGFAQDTFDGLGTHTASCDGGGGGVTDPLINEFLVSHAGADDSEFIEVLGDPAAAYTGFTLLVVNGDPAFNAGEIVQTFPLGTTNAEGYWTTGFLTDAFFNNTQTLLLVEGFSGTAGDDLDADDDGTLDSTPWARLADDVAVQDSDAGDLTYSVSTLGPDGTFLPPGASRIPDGTDTGSPADWAFNDFNLAGINPGVEPQGGYAYNTPGAENQVQVAQPVLVINEILADPDASQGDANGDGTVNTTGDEFVEIVNTGPEPVDISGWTLSDGVSVRHTFPAGTVVQGQCAVLVFADGTPTGDFGFVTVQTASSGQLGLNNGGDTVTLQDDSGTTVDAVTYGGEGGNNQSLTRDPDITGAFVQHSTATGSGGTLFSPGTRIDGASFSGCAAPIPECQLASYAPQTLYPGLTGQALIDQLIADYKPDPADMPPGYGPARDYMYAQIDNDGGTIHGVYSGFTVTSIPQELSTARTAAQNAGLNAEHTWPQSFGIASDEPGARSDLHHLFPARAGVNSARSNYPFAEIPDTETDSWYIGATSQSAVPASNIDGYAELNDRFGGAGSGAPLPHSDRRFEPREVHEGNAARAVFYVAAIYQPLVSGANEQAFFNTQLATLLQWNTVDPVDQTEYVRTCAVGAIQDGKVNPFVIDPTLATRAFLTGVVIGDVQRTPFVPAPADDVTVTAQVTADDALTTVELRYTVNGGAEQAVAMTGSDGTWSGTIPESAYADGDRVAYYVHAETSGSSNQSTVQGFFAGTTPMATLNDRDAEGVVQGLGYGVRVSGIATAGRGTFSSSNLEVYVQDASGALSVFRSGDSVTPFERNHAYTLEGTVDQFNGKTQLAPTVLVAEGAATPVASEVVTIADLLAAPESFENELVRLNGVTSTTDFPAGGSADVTLDDGTGTLTMRIDGTTGLTASDEPEEPYDVVGIFTQFDDSSPYTDGYQLLPRDAGDLIGERPPPPPPEAGPWINELHYDNAGTDTGEFVEVAVPGGYTGFEDLKVVLYNGSNGSAYNTVPLTDFTEGGTENSVTFYAYTFPTNGLQNGSPDGVALCDAAGVVTSGTTPQFLSYEGAFTATEECANGVGSIGIGVAESSSTPVGASLGLTSAPAASKGQPASLAAAPLVTYDLFEWTVFEDDTPGAVNAGQIIPAPQPNTPPVCELIGTGASPMRYLRIEVGDAESGYTIRVDRLTRAQAEIPEGSGTTYATGETAAIAGPGTTVVRAEALTKRKAVFVMTITDAEGVSVTCDPVMTTLEGEQPTVFALDQNYPNPFNPETVIGFSVPEAAHARLAVYDLLGRRVATLVDAAVEAGAYEVTWDGRSDGGQAVAGGVYFYRLEAGTFVQTRTLTILK